MRSPIRLTKQATRSRRIIGVFLVIGLMTTGLDLFLLRTYDLNVNSINPKAKIGERIYTGWQPILGRKYLKM